MDHTNSWASFSDVMVNFRRFLTEQDRPGNVLWIFREDITWHDGTFFLKFPLPETNESLVAKLYEHGCEKGLGLMLDVFCMVAGELCCYIWIPKDARDAELAMVAGLKFSVPSSPRIATAVFDEREWKKHQQLGERQNADNWLNEVPRRSANVG